MYIEKHKVKNEWYLRIVENKKKEKNGKISTVKNIVKGLGKLSKYDNNNLMFFNELRDNFKKGIALIPEIESYINRVSEYDNLNNYEKKNVGYLIFDNLFEFLGLHNLNRKVSKRQFKYDFLGFLKLLVYIRILYPDTKIDFLFRITFSKDYHDIYKVLDILYCS